MFTRVVLSDARARAKPCLRCGYSLRKIESLYCPECGLSAWLSLNGNDSLDGSNPGWLLWLALGTAAMAFAQVLGMLALVFYVFAPNHSRYFGLFYLFAAAGAAVESAGLLVLCLHEKRYPDRVKMRRWACRAAAVLALLAVLPLVWTGLHFMNHPNRLSRLGLLSPLVSFAVGVPILATWVYLQPLAKRGFHPILNRCCRIMLVLPLAGLLLSVAAVILPWVYLPASMVLLCWFSIVFRRAAKSATEHWAKETADPTVAHA